MFVSEVIRLVGQMFGGITKDNFGWYLFYFQKEDN